MSSVVILKIVCGENYDISLLLSRRCSYFVFVGFRALLINPLFGLKELCRKDKDIAKFSMNDASNRRLIVQWTINIPNLKSKSGSFGKVSRLRKILYGGHVNRLDGL